MVKEKEGGSRLSEENDQGNQVCRTPMRAGQGRSTVGLWVTQQRQPSGEKNLQIICIWSIVFPNKSRDD